MTVENMKDHMHNDLSNVIQQLVEDQNPHPLQNHNLGMISTRFHAFSMARVCPVDPCPPQIRLLSQHNY